MSDIESGQSVSSIALEMARMRAQIDDLNDIIRRALPHYAKEGAKSYGSDMH